MRLLLRLIMMIPLMKTVFLLQRSKMLRAKRAQSIVTQVAHGCSTQRVAISMSFIDDFVVSALTPFQYFLLALLSVYI